MNVLTAKETEQLNKLNANTISMGFGTKMAEVISKVPIDGTPVNAVNASKLFTIAGITIDGETITINNPAVAGTDIYEFLADTAQSKTSETNIPIDITSYTTKATRVLTIDTQATSGDTMTIGTKVYTFVPVGTDTADGEISIGTSVATTQAAIVAAINGTDGHNTPHPFVTAGDFAANASTITAIFGGTAANALATTETFTSASNIFAGATLAGGTNCSAANTLTAIIAAVTASDTQGVSVTAGEGTSIMFSADTAGVVGNAIIIGDTMANGSFADNATTLSGGVDGTVGIKNATMMDDTYLYKCIADNSKSGKNWRRVSLGSAY